MARCQGLTSCCWSTAEKMMSNDSPNQRSSSSCHWIVSGAGQRIRTRSMASRSFISLMSKPGHDRLARPWVVRQEETEPRLRQHPQIHGLDLVRQRADAREADGEVAVVRVGEADAGGLDEQAEALGIDGLDRGGCFVCWPKTVAASSRRGWPRPASRRTGGHGTRIRPQGAHGLQDHRLGEVARQVDASADREHLVRHDDRDPLSEHDSSWNKLRNNSFRTS